MDEALKQVLTQLPLVAVVGVALWIVYRDGRADRQYMMDLLERLYKYEIEKRGETIADHQDTLMKRP